MSENVPRQEIARMRQQHIGRLFQQAARDFSQRAMTRLSESGYADIKPFQAELISHIELEGTRISVLAQRLGMTKQTVGEAIAQLEALGYVQRQRDPHDARAQLCCFTQKGEAFLQAAYLGKQALEQDYAQILGVEGLERLKQQLRTILADSAGQG